MDFSGSIQLAIRVGLAASAFAIIIILLTTIQVPVPDFTAIASGLGFAVSTLKYFMPGSGALLNIVLAGAGLAITTWVARFAIVGIKMLFKVNGG